MPSAAVLAAAAAVVPIPGASVVAGALGSGGLSSLVSVIDPGKARDAARIQRRDFFLNAAKGGSVIAARYLINGEANVYTVKEKSQYRDGIKELESGPALWQETLAKARAAGGLWDDAVGAGDMLAVGQRIAVELGQRMNVPAGTLAVNQQGAIESWARQFGYEIRRDTSAAVAQLGAGITSGAASAIAPDGSSNKSSVLLPTNKTTLAVVGLAIVGLIAFAMRKR